MKFSAVVANAVNAFTHKRRKVWQGSGVAYLQLRRLESEQYLSLQSYIDQYSLSLAGVNWARVNAQLGVLVVNHEPSVGNEVITDMLDWAEQRLGVDQQSLLSQLRFPLDHDDYFRHLVTATVDVIGLTAGGLLRLVPGRRIGTGLDIAALASALENVPALNQNLQKIMGEEGTELALSLLSNFGEALMSGWSGSVTDFIQRYHQLRVYRVRCECWQQWEPLLAANLNLHQPGSNVGPVRPNEMPAGPVGQYSSSAAQLAIGGFGFGVAATHSFEQAAASVFSGVPKPARLGAEGYEQQALETLSKAGLLVLNQEALASLDRLTTLVIDLALVSAEFGMITEVQILDEALQPAAIQDHLDQLFDFQQPQRVQRQGDLMLAPVSRDHVRHLVEVELHPELDERHFLTLGLWRDEGLEALVYVQRVADSAARLLINRARELKLDVYVVDHNENAVAWLNPKGLLSTANLCDSIQELQREQQVVLYIAAEDHPALTTADLGLCLWDGNSKPPWQGDLIGRRSLQQAWLLLTLAEGALQNAKQAVELAKIEAVAGLVLSLRQLDELSIRRIKLAANGTALVALLNALRRGRQTEAFPQSNPEDFTPWHALSVEHSLQRLGSSVTGISSELARQRQPQLERAAPSVWRQLLLNWADELANPLTPALAAGAALSALTGSLADALLISGVVVVNGLLGGYQRLQVESKLRALDHQERNQNWVMRDQQLQLLDSQQLVRGDVIALQAGELVPADCRLIIAEHLEVDESSLTGESLPVKKKVTPTYSPVVAERGSMLYGGTSVIQGSCRALVVATGEATEAQRSHALHLQDQSNTGVEARLESITAKTLPISALSGALVLAAGLARHQPTDQLISSGVSLAVAAVPEGLPILATMAQLASAQRLSSEGALVRNPRCIEALGRIDILCADKTGTLTEGKLTLVRVADGFNSSDDNQNLTPRMRQVLIAALRASPNGFVDTALPHTTDQALFDGARKRGLTQVSDLGGWGRIYEKQFKSERGFHGVLGEVEDERIVFIKGAPDKLLPKCRFYLVDQQQQPIVAETAQQFEQQAKSLADAGLRVLCVVSKGMPVDSDRFEDADVIDLVFHGFVALADPIRDTAKQSIATLAKAGVEVKMITGDHPATAQSIAEQLGLAHPKGVITGAQLDQLEDQELSQQFAQTSVFARVTPTQKARIVKLLKDLGHIVAMTGDGANDAAAIRLADVGIALGEKSTPAARAAADLLVATENIDTIVRAVLEGRALWGAVKDAVSLLVGGNLGEIGFTLLGGLLDGRSPLNARQLLLVNLLTDSLPALAVALRRPKHASVEELLKEGPEQSLGQALTDDIAWRALTTGGAATLAWGMGKLWGTPERASTIALLALVGGQLGQTIVKGQRSPTVLATGIGSLVVLVGMVQTPVVSRFFGCQPLGPIGLGQAALASTISAVGSQWLPRLGKNIDRSADIDAPQNFDTKGSLKPLVSFRQPVV